MKIPIKDYKRHCAIYLYWILLLTQIPITAILFKKHTDAATLLYAGIDIYFLYLFFMRHNKDIFFYYIGKLYPVFIYIMWCYISVFWSVSDNTFYDTSLLLKDTIRIFIVILMFSTYERSVFLVAFYRAVGIASFLFGVLALLSVDFVHEYGGVVYRAMYEGYKDAVGVGRQASFLCLLLVSGRLLEIISKRFLIVSLLPCFTVAVLSFSKLSLFSLVVAYYLAFIISNNQGKFTLRNTIAGTVIVLLILTVVLVLRWDYIVSYITVYGGSNVATYSGRLGIWEELILLVNSNVIFGYGLNPVATLLYAAPFVEAGTAHNEVLQQLIAYGLVGFSLWLFMYIKYYLVYRASRELKLAKIMLAFLLFYFLAGTMGSVLVLTIFPIYFIALFWISILYVPMKLRPAYKPRR